MQDNRTDTEQQAYELGCEHARNAASWIIDGNSPREHVRQMIRWLDTCDPRADDYLPRRPNLSGEYANDLTPQSLAADILGADWETHGYNAPDFLPAELVDALAAAYEQGIDDEYETAVFRELRAALEV